ncbi:MULTISPECIES: Ldh family oxidoreductase [Halorussus]|uniref:Ldh family oxidoreductase n=1 Tax=Halorussus TaxID=1070314 RepID=UPI000E219542|nr:MULTISPECIES: Ldh family oxidoreductase [Halorussus]NHN61667.1 Ldh family oxidoreductase [Halorussus sp. JP-T4]
MAPIAPETLREETKVLAFDLRDTLLDRESTLVPSLADLLDVHGSDYDADVLLRRYLAMHFRDSIIDSLVPGPHTPFTEISRRALAYRLEQFGLDVATSQVAHGKIRERAASGDPVPPDWTVTEPGEPETDAAAFEDGSGALLPLGGTASGYEGFGLAVVAELFADRLNTRGAASRCR